MMRALYAGVSGLKTHQTKMDVIGNNIANVNTVAYKSQSITFGELMYQTTQKASGPNGLTGTAGVNPRQIGLGVQAGAISTSITTAGASQTTGNPFDLKITGDAFFVVSDGTSNFFTRDGSFYVDSAGNLAMSSNGYNVMGWGVNEDGTAIKKDTVAALRIMSEENMTYPPESTSKGYVSGIIDKNDPDVNSASGKIMNLKIYDNLGYSYTAKVSMKAMGDSATSGKYTVELVDVLDSNNKSVISKFPGLSLGTNMNVAGDKTFSVADGYTLSSTSLTYTDSAGVAQTVNFDAMKDIKDASGNYLEGVNKLAAAYGFEGKTEEFLKYYVTDGTGAQKTIGELLANGNFATAMKDVAGGDFSIEAKGRNMNGAIIEYDTDTGKFKGIDGSTEKTGITLTMNNGGANGNFSDVVIDFKTSSMFDNSGTSTIQAKNGDTNGVGAGRKLGELAGLSIQNNGMIYASYDNGQTRLLGQIAVAEFANASGLEKCGSNLYQSTLNSGDFDGIGVDISANGGSVSTGVLEMSNVDLSAEFTEMITAQRGFQANSRIITVSDTLLEELVNLKR